MNGNDLANRVLSNACFRHIQPVSFGAKSGNTHVGRSGIGRITDHILVHNVRMKGSLTFHLRRDNLCLHRRPMTHGKKLIDVAALGNNDRISDTYHNNRSRFYPSAGSPTGVDFVRSRKDHQSKHRYNGDNDGADAQNKAFDLMIQLLSFKFSFSLFNKGFRSFFHIVTGKNQAEKIGFEI